VLAVIYGLKQIAEDGLALLSALAIVTGLAVGVMFVRRQRALADPLIDLRLFRVPAFSVSLATNIIGLFAALGAFLFVAQYLQLVLGLSPLQAGLWTAPSSGGLIVGSILAPAIVHRVGVRPAFVMAAGLVLAAVGFGVLTQVEGSSGLSVLVTGSVVFSLGIAPTVTLSTDLIVGTAPPERAGAASAMSETGTELGGALGIAILGSIGTAVYRSEVGEGVPAAVPSAAAEAARDTLATALAVAEQLPEELGAALLGAAREAFTQGLRLTAAISAGHRVGHRRPRSNSAPRCARRLRGRGAARGRAGLAVKPLTDPSHRRGGYEIVTTRPGSSLPPGSTTTTLVPSSRYVTGSTSSPTVPAAGGRFARVSSAASNPCSQTVSSASSSIVHLADPSALSSVSTRTTRPVPMAAVLSGIRSATPPPSSTSLVYGSPVAAVGSISTLTVVGMFDPSPAAFRAANRKTLPLPGQIKDVRAPISFLFP
jgi:hypothetical protein